LTGPGAGVRFCFCAGYTGGTDLSRLGKKSPAVDLSRRKFLLRYWQGAPLAFLPTGLGFPFCNYLCPREAPPSPSEFHVRPQYRAERGIDALLKKVRAGSDAFVTEKYHDQIASVLRAWSSELLESPQKTAALENAMTPDFLGASPRAVKSHSVRARSTLKVWRMEFGEGTNLERERFLNEWRSGMDSFSELVVAEFQVTNISASSSVMSAQANPDRWETRVRFELAGTGAQFHREQRIGYWDLEWELLPGGATRIRQWRIVEEMRSRSLAPVFVDIAAQAFDGNLSYSSQMSRGTDYWRTVLDGACGIDIYGHNGVSVADVDGDGFDDLYVCQPAGLPNRLYRNRGDGSFEDITEASGLGVLENTACALFADIHNHGRQDVILVRADGPVLFLNEGGGKFRLKPDAFHFASSPQGTFTGAAIADYDRDGWLDVYFCLYSYYQGAGQYRYPAPYYAAENGPPNFMMRNNRDGTFRDVTRESGLDHNNTRFSFCCGWGDDNGDQWPDLYVVNDFGRKNLYRNNGKGVFTDIAGEAGVEDIGAGMSVCWFDYDNDGKEDLYVADMWTAAGNRISAQPAFQKNGSGATRDLYRKHAMGNSLFRNRRAGGFEDDSARSGTAMGRWSWSSDAWDFDHDGFADLYIANGMISGSARDDLNSFFWRQVVANSPTDAKPNQDYEQGWTAINELIRSDGTWSGFERNVFYLNNHDGTFSDISTVAGVDFIEDSRSFALADFDQDGRLEVVLKNRSGPQLRLLKNVMSDLSPSIAFRLTGTTSNRDAIGAEVIVESKAGRQTRRVQAGSGFLAQHSKDLLFGLGETTGPVTALIRWPSGLQQDLQDLPLNHRIWVTEGSLPSRIEAFRSRALLLARPSVAYAADMRSVPASLETWLLAPVAAPDFSLPDLAGRVQTLSARLGKVVLLHFWSAVSPDRQTELQTLDRAYARWHKKGLELVAVNTDQVAGADLALYGGLSFPVLRASPDFVAIYNILYRYIFDRHRDISLPTSFLIDEKGAIVKIYQGPIQIEHWEKDIHEIPRTANARLAKALPFPGVIESVDFGRNYLSYGSVFFERGYLEPAEAAFRQAQRDDPSGAEAYYGLGSVYLQQQKTKAAQENFERAVQLRSNYPGTLPRAWNNLGILAAQEGRIEEAIEDFQRALRVDPDLVIALGNLGNAYRQQKNWDPAKSALQRALALNPEDPDANYSMGMVFAQLNDTDRAYEYLQKALAARPVYPEALNNLGILCLRTQRREQAEQAFKDSIRLAPAFDQSYLNLARVYVLSGDTQLAREVLLELLKQHPGHAQAEKELEQLPW
jgi:tetratricopeptide (TPR) repeat protein/thiol-disulfide isomerase/thioredoxin